MPAEPLDGRSARSVRLAPSDVALDRRVAPRFRIVTTLLTLVRPSDQCPSAALLLDFVEQVERRGASGDLPLPPIQHPFPGVDLAFALIGVDLTAVSFVVATPGQPGPLIIV